MGVERAHTLPVDQSLFTLTNIWPKGSFSESHHNNESKVGMNVSADTNVNTVHPFPPEHQLCSSRGGKCHVWHLHCRQFNWIRLQKYGLCVVFVHSPSLPCEFERERLLWCITPAQSSLLWAVAKIWAPGLSRCHSRPFQLSGYQHPGNCSSLMVKTDVHCWL